MTTGYTYDILNRLTEIKEASIEKITYEYDGNGLMQSKTDVETGTTTQFIYDGANIVAEVTNGVTTAYVRGVRLISMDNGEDKLYYHHNPHGDVEKLTNASGETIEEYTYDAYGNQRVSIGALNPFRYCGEYWDGPKTVGETQVGETVYVSDMAWISSSNGWGPVMRDHAHSGWDGNNLTPITLGGQEYSKGIGAHAESEIQVSLGGDYESFHVIVGADDIAGQWANVVFKVYGDGELLFESPQMIPGDTPIPVNLDVSDVDILKLYADPGVHPNDDYADWADAKLIKKATDTSNITYISEMSWLSSSNGWGPIMRDYAHSGVNGTNLTPLTLGGQEYAKGVGAHAESEIQVALDGNYETFKAIVGADDIAGQWANVVFKVYGDGELLFESPQMLPGDTPVSIDIDVSGVDILTLYADPGTYPNDDYADWADARLEKSTEATITDPTTTHGSGLIYLRNRWYDPSIGRFINQDPVKDDFNWYIYCHNDPMNFRDPSGLSDILLRKFVESNGGTVTPNQHEFLGIKWGLKSITVSLNGITREFSAGSTYNTYRINEKSFSLMDDKFLLNAFFGDIGSGTDTNPTKQQIVNHITRRAYYADIPKNLAFAVAYTESTMQQIQNSTGRVDNGGGDWGIMQINDENVPRYTDAYGDIIGNWHNNVNAGVEHIRVCYAEVLELGYTGDEIYKATYSNYNSGSASKYTYNTEVADNVNRFWEIYNGQIWR